MKALDELLSEFPESVRAKIKQIWNSLPEEQREQIEDWLDSLPVDFRHLKRLLALVLSHYKPLFTKHRIAIVGPANVGKSTLYNQLVSKTEDQAEVGPVPGTTRENQEADTGLFTLVDTPGADAVGAVGEREREIAFQAAESADFLVVVFEATRGIKRYESELFDRLLDLDKPFIVVLNKMDMVPKRHKERVVGAAARNLRLEKSQIIETVATKGRNVGRVVLAIAKFEPGLAGALGEALPEYRAHLSWQRILAAATAAGAVGWIPLPFMDLIPLLAIQSGMVLSIARIYGFKITAARAKELIATFGLGFAARWAFQQLSKLGGVPGWVLSAAIAAATTVAIGYAAMMWFAYGEKPTQDALNRMVVELSDYLREQLRSLGQKRPDRSTLRERIAQALRNLPEHLRPGRQAAAEHSEEERSEEAGPLDDDGE